MTDQMQTDPEIIRQVLNGEQSVFAVLMAKYEPAFLRYAQQFTKDADDAADVVQEAFIKIYRNLTANDPKRPFSSWAYRIVKNEALNWLRSRKRITFGEAAEYVLNRVFAQSTPELEYVAVETHDQLSAALECLPVTYRKPLELHALEERSYKEISAQLNLPIGTVGTRINRAKSLLKRMWTKSDTND